MDFNSIRDQVSNLTLYDLKAGVRKVQNAVMNYTEMEAKVREATNNEPWGTSSTLMQEIANGTYSYQLLNEIMPMIYKRFTEKAAEEWRQIYKALQLLEFLIKNGSERVIDDARSHLSLLKMLRQFYYIDQNGKDQGINVRNRAKELAELLGDVDRIRSERKKARSNRNKFGGVAGGNAMGGMSGTSSRYGGFGSEDASYGGYSGGTFGDGGGFGGSTSGDFSDSARQGQFEEYDEADEVEAPPARPRKDHPSNTSARRKQPDPPKKAPEVDLFEFGDDDIAPAAPPKTAGTPGGAASTATTGGDDEDFDDFISATPSTSGAASTAATNVSSLSAPPAAPSTGPSTASFALPKPTTAPQGPNYSAFTSISSMSPAPSQSTVAAAPGTTAGRPASSTASSTGMNAATPRPSGYQAAQPNYFTSVPVAGGASTNGQITTSKPATTPGASAFGNGKAPAGLASKPTGGSGGAGGDAFSNLWSTTSAGAGIQKSNQGSGPNLASLAKEKASASIWGPSAKAGGSSAGGQANVAAPSAAGSSSSQQQPVGGGLDDLLG